ncbi:hypothetical protein LRP50_05310 [Enterovibrio sp. ZSDZ42]|uniref:Uncharacterized protein n=1 Tax=Enterovibrio gelatinilyticus TaxID=2899819 RepID=A0ABT5QX04_9GAMM|nr:hypothetical protein [Enterovibrio sp. ZSDZ42]MDD1792545.1 hypothetical protein [Enterovibrio sp. ZSDZ42]
MENQNGKDLKSAIDGLIWLSAESVGERYHVDVSVWASRKEMQVEIIDLSIGADAIYLDSTHGIPFTVESINAMEDRVIEKLAELNEKQEQAA